jgi:hypothetical protein
VDCSPCERAKRFELGSGLLQFGNHFAVAAPGVSKLVRLSRRYSFQISTHGFVLGLDSLVATLQPIEPIPELGAEPLGSLFFRRAHD